MSAFVLALLDASAPLAELSAGFEEEGVPLVTEPGRGSREALAHDAAARSPLGLGIGGDAGGLVLALASWRGRPYLEAAPAEARAFGHAAARVAARRPL